MMFDADILIEPRLKQSEKNSTVMRQTDYSI